MRQHLDARDILSHNPFLAPQLQRHVDGRMRASATGKLFEPDGIGFDLPRLAPILEQFADVEGTGSVEDVQEALMMLERIGGGIEAALRQQGCEKSVTAALADMKRLGHGAE